MAKKIAEKAKLVNLLPEISETNEVPLMTDGPPTVTPRRAYTGVGELMNVLGKSSPLGKELDEVKARLAEYEGSIPLKLMDPKLIARSKWANRHHSEFESVEFARLKAEIENAGVNVQPIKVRPIQKVEPGGYEYEIIFGHRRHKACLDLDILVFVMIEEADDKKLWLQMERENRERQNLSPYEQGCSILRALEAGLFPSIRKLAEESGIDQSNATKALSLAKLPSTVVEAFQLPSHLQFGFAGLLNEALQKDPEGTLLRAKALKDRGIVPRSGKAVLNELLGINLPASRQINDKNGKLFAIVTSKPGGTIGIEIRQEINIELVEQAVRNLLRDE